MYDVEIGCNSTHSKDWTVLWLIKYQSAFALQKINKLIMHL